MTSKDRKLAAVTRTAAASTTARDKFERAIKDAHPDATVREIAEAAGLSKSRVHDIVTAP